MYQQLCSNVDTIVHNGALVNHAYSYEQLFEPNVLGTVEVRHSPCPCSALLKKTRVSYSTWCDFPDQGLHGSWGYGISMHRLRVSPAGASDLHPDMKVHQCGRR